MARTIKIVLSVAAIGGALAWVLASGFGGSMVYYRTPDEILETADRLGERTVRVAGTVVPGSIRRIPGTDRYRFEIRGNERSLEVSYSGLLPDAMKEGREVVVHGVLGPDRAVFRATEILTKCPSKYQGRSRAVGP